MEKVTKCLDSSPNEVRIACMYLRMQLARIKLLQGKAGECKVAVDEAKAELEPLSGVDPAVHAAVHLVASQLHKAERAFANFYRSALAYLSYVNAAEDLDSSTRQVLAVDLCLAALLGDDVYSFGELLEHSIIDEVRTSDCAWLLEVLRAFHGGDAAQYDKLCVTYGRQLNAQPALVANERALREKITIMSLLELAFKLPPDERTVSLRTVAQATGLDLDGVEFLLMKALSLGLIRGSIDHVGGTVEITWVQPRVLTTQQISTLGGRLGGWLEKVSSTATAVSAEAPELLLT